VQGESPEKQLIPHVEDQDNEEQKSSKKSSVKSAGSPVSLEEIDVKVLDPTHTQSADMNSSSPSLRVEEALNMKTLSSNDSYESP